jgi:acetyl/propionyl-CoA carboxylase alpha subunit
MTFEIDVNGRSRTVSVERTGPGRFRLSLDGVQHEVDAVRIGTYGLSLMLDDGHSLSREVSTTPGPLRGELLVGLDGRSVAVTVNGRRTGRAAGDAGTHAPGEVSVVAPMPGRVVRVLVAVGDEVAAKQAVVVVEAMKMENELRSPKAGRVKDVSVTPGTSVDAGRVLVTIE